MRKNHEIELKIEDMDFPSKGFGYYDGKKIYVKNTLPGQRVRAWITKIKKEYAEARLLEVVENSALESSSFCKHFGKCGGCTYQTLPYEKQLEIKSMLVKKLFEQSGIRDFEFLGIEGSPEPFSYRNKMEYSFGDEEKGGEMTLGMHKKGRLYDIVTVENCGIVHQDFNEILKNTLTYFQERKIPYYHTKTQKGFLRHLVVRKSAKREEILIVLVTTTQENVDMKGWVERMLQLKLQGKIVGILHTFNDSLADAVINEKTQILWGQNYFCEEILGLVFKVSAFSFFQTNSLGAERLYRIVLDFLGDAKDKTVFDLYCGTGTIGQIVAKNAKEVIGIEIVEEAVEAANENAAMNGLENCTFIAGDVLKKIDELHQKPDVIILDPPRSGVNPKALRKILKHRAPEIIYVSCNPKTLVDNLVQMQEEGYQVRKVKCMDMFPHTPHVECVVEIQRSESSK